jgi:hypothetical protein
MADMVIFNGRKYYPQIQSSEQIDALKVTAKWTRLGLDEAAKVSISETELRNYAQIYPRLYQVPRQTQARLRAWMDRNEEAIQDWDLGDFFKTVDDDARDDTEPRNPGCPDEVMESWKSSLDRQQTDQGSVDQGQPANGSDNNDPNAEIHPLISQESERARHEQGGQGTEMGCQIILALEGSLGRIKEVAARLEQLSNNFYLEDSESVKEELLALAQSINTNVDRSSRARNTVSQVLGKGTVDRRLEKKPKRNRIVKAKRGKNRNRDNNNDEVTNNDEDENESKDQWLVWGSGTQPELAGLVREQQNSEVNDLPVPQDDNPMPDVDPRLRTAFIGSYQLRIGPVNDGSIIEAIQNDQDREVGDVSASQNGDPMEDIAPPSRTASIGSYQLRSGSANDLPGPQDNDSMAEAAIDPRLRTAFIGPYRLRNEDVEECSTVTSRHDSARLAI